MNQYKGAIIQEGLTDTAIFDDIEVISIREEQDQDDPRKIWHLYTVTVSQEDIAAIQPYLKRDGGWYAHFWNGNDVIVIFRDKAFSIKYNDKATWQGAIDYGLSMGVPKEQLDFRIE